MYCEYVSVMKNNIYENNMFDYEFGGFFSYTLSNLRNAIFTIISNLYCYATNPNFCTKVNNGYSHQNGLPKQLLSING